MFYTLKRVEGGIAHPLTFATSLDGLLAKIDIANPMTEELRAIALELDRFEEQGVGTYSLGNGWWLTVTG